MFALAAACTESEANLGPTCNGDPTSFDLSHWAPVMEMLDFTILAKAAELCKEWKGIKARGNWGSEGSGTSYKEQHRNHVEQFDKLTSVVCACLRLLSLLLKFGRNKRYFVFLTHIGELLYSDDDAVVGLSLELAYLYCVRSSSVAPTVWDIDSKEGAEAPNILGDGALIIFEGLGCLSSSYGMLDFIRGHEPPMMRHGIFNLEFP
jgi:hypothetical protein